MGNIDLTKELVFGVWNISAEEADNGKAKSGVKMYQDDTKLEYYIGYDEMPEPTTKKKGSKTIWNFDDQEEFLYDSLSTFKNDNFLDESVSESLPPRAEKPKAPAKATPRKAKVKAPSTDDLPF